MSCPHHNVQQYTEICLDCGANVYESPEERVERLRREVDGLRRTRLDAQLKVEGDALEIERDFLLRRGR